MPWYSKEQPTPFDTTPIEGLQFLHGDVMARQYQQAWLRGQKYPLIRFPSEVSREVITQESNPDQPQVHIFGSIHLPYRANRTEAFRAALPLAAEQGYAVVRVDEDTLSILNPATRRSYHLTYDNAQKQLVSITPYPREAMELLPGDIRAALPRLYRNEKLGLRAVAPVKFFTPDSAWSWYPTEYDGEDLCFGLVSGFEVELGYFSVAELERVRGPLGLPIERDLYFEPKTLRALQSEHKRR